MPTGPLTKQPSWRQAPAGGHPIGVSVVIVTYRNEADIGACLSAVGHAAPGIPMEVIVVDNALDDGTVAAARAAGGATIVERRANGGFAAGAPPARRRRPAVGCSSSTPTRSSRPMPSRRSSTALRTSGDGHRRWPVRPPRRHQRSSLLLGQAQPVVGGLLRGRADQPASGQPDLDPEAPQPWSRPPAGARRARGQRGVHAGAPAVVGHARRVRPGVLPLRRRRRFLPRAAATGCRPRVTARAVPARRRPFLHRRGQARAAVHGQGHAGPPDFRPGSRRRHRPPAGRRAAARHGEPDYRPPLGRTAGEADRARG